MNVDGVYTSLGSRLDTNFQSAAAPPTTGELVDSVGARPSTEFQQNFSASKFTPDPSKRVDVAV